MMISCRVVTAFNGGDRGDRSPVTTAVEGLHEVWRPSRLAFGCFRGREGVAWWLAAVLVAAAFRGSGNVFMAPPPTWPH
jgi:hypothetical protein